MMLKVSWKGLDINLEIGHHQGYSHKMITFVERNQQYYVHACKNLRQCHFWY